MDARRLLPAVAVAAVVVLGGCDAEVSIGGASADGEELAEEIRAEYEDETGIALTELTCEDLDAEVGAELSCEGRNARDVELVVGGEVTSVDEGEDDIRYRWTIVRAVAPGEVYAAAARRQLEAEVGEPLADLTCPERIVVAEGETVRCELVTTDGATLGATLRLTDRAGGFDIEVDEPADR